MRASSEFLFHKWSPVCLQTPLHYKRFSSKMNPRIGKSIFKKPVFLHSAHSLNEEKREKGIIFPGPSLLQPPVLWYILFPKFSLSSGRSLGELTGCLRKRKDPFYHILPWNAFVGSRGPVLYLLLQL